MAKELICVHNWGPWFERFAMEDKKSVDVSFRVCLWCETTWYRRNNEPRIVVMRLEEGPESIKHLAMGPE